MVRRRRWLTLGQWLGSGRLVLLGHGYGLATATIHLGVTQPCQVDKCAISMSCRGPLTHTPLFPLGSFGAVLPPLERFAGCRWCQANQRSAFLAPKSPPPTNDSSAFATHSDMERPLYVWLLSVAPIETSRVMEVSLNWTCICNEKGYDRKLPFSSDC